MTSGRSDLVEIDCACVGETDLAWRVDNGKTKVWIPKSQCEADWARGVVEMPEWLAIERGLV